MKKKQSKPKYKAYIKKVQDKMKRAKRRVKKAFGTHSGGPRKRL